VVAPGWSGNTPVDLYAPYSLAQGAEMLAWGLLFGAAALLGSRLLSTADRERWAARLLAGAGILSIVAWLTYLAAQLIALPAWVGGVAVGIGGLAWAVLWPLSTLLFARKHWSLGAAEASAPREPLSA